MKATLEFDLSDIDDRQARLGCVKANDMVSVLWKFATNSRKKLEIMKKLTVGLITILAVVLGRWILTLEGFPLNFLMVFYSATFMGIFSYGVYKILESFEE